MKVIETEEGLLIPKEELEQLGEWEVEERAWQITIRAKDLTEPTEEDRALFMEAAQRFAQIAAELDERLAAIETKLQAKREVSDGKLG